MAAPSLPPWAQGLPHGACTAALLSSISGEVPSVSPARRHKPTAGMPGSRASPSVVSSASPANLLEMQFFWPRLRPAESELLGQGWQLGFNKPSGDSDVH